MADITFQCPNCGKPLTIEDRAAGMTMNCISCGKPLTVPSVSAPLLRTAPGMAGGQQQQVAVPVTPGLATGSLVMGVLSFCFGPLLGIPAIICGHVARSKIERSNGQLTGGGVALAGLILGYMSFVLIVPLLAAIAIPSFVNARTKAQQNACINNLRLLSGARDQYALDHDGRAPGSTQELVPVYLAKTPTCPASGTYSLGPLSTDPECSLGGNGHTL